MMELLVEERERVVGSGSGAVGEGLVEEVG